MPTESSPLSSISEIIRLPASRLIPSGWDKTALLKGSTIPGRTRTLPRYLSFPYAFSYLFLKSRSSLRERLPYSFAEETGHSRLSKTLSAPLLSCAMETTLAEIRLGFQNSTIQKCLRKSARITIGVLPTPLSPSSFPSSKRAPMERSSSTKEELEGLLSSSTLAIFALDAPELCKT